jgi:S1-C subfamily serine protease
MTDRIRLLGAILAVLALVEGGTAAAQSNPAKATPPPKPPPQQSAPAQAVAAADSCVTPLPELYDAVSPAVVSITSISINPYNVDHRLDRALGSGVIIDSSGLILTNSHVVFGRQVLTVTLDDGTTLAAKFIGADPIFDVALIKIPPPSQGTLPVAKLGDSSNLVVGEDVYIIGNPLGLDQTLSRGIVSAINRTLPGAAWSLTEPMIQTDASINPGNSGGPMIDPCGLVVGVTTAILPDAQNIGFAVPINLVKLVVPQLLDKGRMIRPWLGVQGQFVVPGLKDLLRVPLVDGFLIEAVEPGSPADQKGLRGGIFELTIDGQPILLGGDIITQVNGKPLDDPNKLGQTLDSLKVASILKLTLFREGKSRDIELTLTERPVLLWDMPGRRTATGPTATGGPGTVAGRPASSRRTIIF